MKRLLNTASIRLQRGFTLIELSVVALILLVLAVVGIPAIQDLMVENRAPAAAKDLQSAVQKMRMARASSGASATPYSSVSIAELGAMLRNTSYEVTGNPATAVAHPIGSGAAAATTAIAVGTLTTAGDSFVVSLADVAGQACSSFASTFGRQAEGISITPNGGSAATVKAAGGTFNAQLAQTTCGARNTISLTFR